MNITISRDLETLVDTSGPYPVLNAEIASDGREKTTVITLAPAYDRPLTLGSFTMQEPRWTSSRDKLKPFVAALDRTKGIYPNLMEIECDQITFYYREMPMRENVIEAVEMRYRVDVPPTKNDDIFEPASGERVIKISGREDHERSTKET